jgi:hypothetical protein
VDAFMQQYLLCGCALPEGAVIAFRPGPAIVRQVLHVSELRDTVAYPLCDVMDTLSSLPRLRGSPPSVQRWSLNDRWIELTTHTAGNEWLETQIECYCTYGDIVWMWLSICRRHPAVLLQYGDERLYTPRLFMDEIVLPRLSRAFNSSDNSTRVRAEQELLIYRLVARDALRT